MSSKLFKKYVKNYMCILGIILVLLIPIYVTIYQGTKQLILNETYSRLEQDITDLDNQINKMNIIVELLSSNEYVKQLSKISGEPVASDAIAMLKAKEFLNSCFLLKVENISEYLVFRDNNIVITMSAILSDSAYQRYDEYGQSDISFEEFRKSVFENKRNVQYICQKENGKSNGIIGVLKVMGGSKLNYNTAFIFELEQELLHKILKMEKSQTDFAYVTDKYGEMLYQLNYNGEPLSQKEYEEDRIRMDGSQFTLIRVQAENSGLIWTLGISNETIEQGIDDVNRIISLYMISAALGMILFCVFWALQRAHAMDGILSVLKYDDSKKLKNELQYIAREINDLSDENENYRAEVYALHKSIAGSMLEKLVLRGVYSSKEKEEIQNYLHWDMEFYCVVCVNIRLEQEKEVLDCFYLTDKFFDKNFVWISLNISKAERVYIVRMKGEDAPDTAKVSGLIRSLLEKQDGMQVGISSIGTGLENIQRCYQQAKLAVRQIAVNHDIGIREYHEQSDSKNKIFKLNLENRIYDLIFAEEKNTLKALFEKIKTSVYQSNWHTEAEIMQLFFEIQNPIARVWDEMESKNDSAKEILSYRSDKTVMELIDALEDASYNLCDCISAYKENSKNSLYAEMIQFVEEHYANKDMCVSYAASHLGISDKRFVVIFKEQTGKNFSAYVESRRMQQAEKYLLETDWSMARIADEVGYNTIDTFYKSFKKIYKLPPKKWRESRI